MLDTLSDLQMTVITQIDSLPEAKCEVPHWDSTCTVEVRWSCPPTSCGCHPRMLACQGLHDYVFDPTWDGANFRCGCGDLIAAEVRRTGWYPV